ncbi:DNA-binding domain-containing protein [Labilibaculum sp. K2S]|uniref:DNA-binding domain-containing protein n=1 Tax=Labilibaculum sp. K2S TaxID=3056386 RepID=UPI0025A39D95|nr:DNA-binding domain-containing protein [Labilibaculum sp. K2S]MDM8159287.1 DNA-binding domain-containing protein [Labilibaculum sp. K2S]
MSKVNVWLYDNLLTPDPNDFYGKVKPQGTLYNGDIADAMIKEGTEYQKETILNILDRSDRIKVAKLVEGYSINTGVYHSHIGINGAFHGATDRFDPNEHRITASFISSTALREELKKTQVDIVGTATTEPVIGKVIDSLTKAEDSTITPGNVISIQGNRLKIAGDDAIVGVYLINQNDDSRHKCAQIITNEPKQLLVMLPALEVGNYALEIVTQFSANSLLLKEPREIQFEQILIVD